MIMNPVFTQLTNYAGQYGVVQYDDETFGCCNIDHFTSPTQEGSNPAWAVKANNMLGTTYNTSQEAQDQLHQTLGGLYNLGQDTSNPLFNPFQDQFTASDFPDGQTIQGHF
jgi:hypothetical protein